MMYFLNIKIKYTTISKSISKIDIEVWDDYFLHEQPQPSFAFSKNDLACSTVKTRPVL